MKKQNTGKTLLAMGAAVCFAVVTSPFTQAALIPIATIGVTSSSEIGGAFTRFDDHLVNGSGLVGGAHGITPDGSMWLSGAAGFGGVDPDPWVTFDLGAVYTINSFHIWNYNEGVPNLTNRGVKGVSVEYGTTAALGSTVAGVTQFAQADGLATYAGENFNAFPSFNARYVKIDIASGINVGNWGDASTFYGLSEVQFDGVRADVITGVTIEDFSSQLSGFGGRHADDTINGSGFTESTGVHDGAEANMWLTDGPFESGEGNDVLPSHITYDLEGNYDLDSLEVWNYNEAAGGGLTSRGAKDVEILVASSEGGAFTSLGNFVFDEAPNTTSDFRQVIDLSGFLAADDVRLIRFDITTNWDVSGTPEGVVGLSEVRFYKSLTASTIPAPAALPAGLAMLGLAAARRRRR